MNIYHIARDEGKVDWDETAAFVVVAASEEEARTFADEIGHPHGWKDAGYASCTLIGRACPKTAAGVVLVDFRAG